MNYYRDIVLINSSEIIDVVRRALSKIDPQLIDHGERVGYIASKIYNACSNKSQLDLSRLIILCVLHDIGAYKTDEIDEMVKFETEMPLAHSIYGYLFLKNTIYLSEYAKAILYHHTPYSDLKNDHSLYLEYAKIIYLADRTDIILHSKNHNLSSIRRMSGTTFDPNYVDALFKAENYESFSEKITSEKYKEDLPHILNSLTIKNDEIMDYLKLLVYSIDFRSPYTVTHTADTTLISIETAKLLRLKDKEIQVLYTGAFLHDIGKIAIPHYILEKKDKLTENEFKIIKSHISEGDKILRGIVSDEICDIALRHHEKLDGSGYPNGLTGDKLTLSQRIVAVSDILSALSQERSYKKSFPKEKVISILTSMKNLGLICPLVVDTICGNYDHILANTAKSHDPVKMMYKNMMKDYSTYCSNFKYVPNEIPLNKPDFKVSL